MSNRKASLFVLAAPSGAGKTTLVHALVARHPEIRFSISYTTRPQRRNEADGVDYLFVDKESFVSLREQGEMLESATVFDNLYGTSRKQVENHLRDGHDVRSALAIGGGLAGAALRLRRCVAGYDQGAQREDLQDRGGDVLVLQGSDLFGDLT